MPGADEPGDGWGGFVDFGVGVGSAGSGGVDDAVPEVIVEAAGATVSSAEVMAKIWVRMSMPYCSSSMIRELLG